MRYYRKTFLFFLAIFFAFFDFASFLPCKLKSNFLTDLLKTQIARADTATQFPASNYIYSGTGFTVPNNLYADDDIAGASIPPRNSGSGNVYGNFGFDGSIPADSTINSVNIIYKFRVSTTASKAIQRVKVRINGTELAGRDNTSEPLAYQTIAVDITTDRSWTRNDLLDGVFEIIAEPRRGNPAISYTAFWDYVKVEVDFIPPPNITSVSANNGQIGNVITVFGNNFGSIIGTLVINNKIAANINSWTDTQIEALIPGQEGAADINGKIQITRSSDGKTSNQYPPDPASFTILAPSVSGSSPTTAISGQTVSIEFSGAGIDTDIGFNPILKLTKTGETDIVGSSYLKITDYQTVQAAFDLTGASMGYWKLVIENMDAQSGSFGDESTMGFLITSAAPPPIVTGINPAFGNNSGIISIASISGGNFQNGAAAKLTKTVEIDIAPTAAFAFIDANTLSNGAFDLSGKTLGWWNVIVTNPDSQSGSYGNEVDAGFEIRSARPSLPSNIYQFKNSADIAEPPTTNIAVGEGIGGELTIYFRMDMEGGTISDNYYPQIELKPLGVAFECDNASPSPCPVTEGFFAEGSGIVYNGAPAQGWADINAADGNSYHWQARIRNSSGTSGWVSFGGNSDPNDLDIYIDNTVPAISPGTDGTCATAAIDITDLNAAIRWNTSDAMSGFEPPPGAGSFATAQAQYIKTSDFADWISTPGALSTQNPRENSPHQITLTGLNPSTSYTYRMISKDAVGNLGIYENCVFTTSSTRPIKTTQFFILQETSQNTGTRISKNFSVYIPESPSADISVKSAFIEITGISSDTNNQIVNIELRRGFDQTYVPAGADYIIDSAGTTTAFMILFDVLNPPGTGQQDMGDITAGGSIYEYTLFLNGTVVPISSFSAKLIITYSYML